MTNPHPEPLTPDPSPAPPLGEVVKELRALLEKATPGPWKWTKRYKTLDCRATKTLVYEDKYYHGVLSCDGLANSPNEYDEELITATRNYLPTILSALEASEARVKERDRLIEDIKDECQMNMSRSKLSQRRAKEDGHDSEDNHQDGRWHGNCDIHDFIEREQKKLHETEGA